MVSDFLSGCGFNLSADPTGMVKARSSSIVPATPLAAADMLPLITVFNERRASSASRGTEVLLRAADGHMCLVTDDR